MLAAGLVVSRFVHMAAVLALFGGSLFPLYAYAGEPSDRATRLGAWFRPMQIVLILTAIASGMGWFTFTAASMSGSLAGAADPQVLAAVLEETDFGPLWLGRLTVLLVLLVLLAAWRLPESRPWIGPSLAALALASLAGTGHARVTEGWSGAIHLSADVLHLIAAGFWLGGLWPLGRTVVVSRRAHPAESAEIAGVLMRFSGLGYVAVAVLIASGLLNSWFLVGSVGRLTGTDYGRLLLAKIGLFGAMALLAVANRFWITPRLARASAQDASAWLGRLRRHIISEQALGLIVVGIVSVLGTLQPAFES